MFLCQMQAFCRRSLLNSNRTLYYEEECDISSVDSWMQNHLCCVVLRPQWLFGDTTVTRQLRDPCNSSSLLARWSRLVTADTCIWIKHLLNSIYNVANAIVASMFLCQMQTFCRRSLLNSNITLYYEEECDILSVDSWMQNHCVVSLWAPSGKHYCDTTITRPGISAPSGFLVKLLWHDRPGISAPSSSLRELNTEVFSNQILK